MICHLPIFLFSIRTRLTWTKYCSVITQDWEFSCSRLYILSMIYMFEHVLLPYKVRNKRTYSCISASCTFRTWLASSLSTWYVCILRRRLSNCNKYLFGRVLNVLLSPQTQIKKFTTSLTRPIGVSFFSPNFQIKGLQISLHEFQGFEFLRCFYRFSCSSYISFGASKPHFWGLEAPFLLNLTISQHVFLVSSDEITLTNFKTFLFPLSNKIYNVQTILSKPYSS